MSTRRVSVRLRACGRRLEPFAYLLPALCVLAFVVAWPIAEAIRLSFFQVYLLSGDTEQFNGLANYLQLLGDPKIHRYLLNTVIFVVGTLTLEFAIGLTFAVLLNRRIRLRALWRALALIPWAMPISVVALTWRWIYNGQWGILNFLLRPFGLTHPVAWLSDPNLVWPSVIVASAWAGFPFVFVLLLSGLHGIPQDVYEAASIDGAGRWTTFRGITVPLLKPVIIVTALLNLILLTREFSTIWTLTSGGPGTTTMTLAPWAYVVSFRFFKLSEGATVGVFLALISMTFTILYLRRLRLDPAAP